MLSKEKRNEIRKINSSIKYLTKQTKKIDRLICKYRKQHKVDDHLLNIKWCLEESIEGLQKEKTKIKNV